MEEKSEPEKEREPAEAPGPVQGSDAADRPVGPERLLPVVPAPVYQVIGEILAFTMKVDEACSGRSPFAGGGWETVRDPRESVEDRSAPGLETAELTDEGPS